MQNQEIVKIIENLGGRRSYEEKRASKFGFTCLYDYFEYIAGSDTFSFNKPDPRHLTNVVEIIQGDIKKTIMIGDSEVDGKSAENANIPFVLVKDGYTEKSSEEIKHDELIKDFKNFDKIIEKYL